MKALLVTPFYKDSVVGPGKFAVLIKGALPDLVDILTENTEDSDVFSISVNLNYFEKKLTQYFNRKYYHRKINEILLSDSQYTHVIFINGILGYGFKSKVGMHVKVVHMINHEQYAILKFYPRLRYFAECFYVWMEKHTIRKAQYLIVNSEYLKSKLIQDFAIDPSRIFVLRKSIMTSKYSFKPDKETYQKAVKILFVKSDWKRGGVEDIAGALKLLPEVNFILTIAGPGKEHEKTIKQLFAKLDNVEVNFLGKQSESEIIQLLAEHNILCIPSRSEALGVAIMEGLASGIPVVTTNVGGIGEVTNNGEYAWVADPENPESLSETIRQCLNNPALRKEKSLAGIQFVKREFDYSVMIKNFAEYLFKD